MLFCGGFGDLTLVLTWFYSNFFHGRNFVLFLSRLVADRLTRVRGPVIDFVQYCSFQQWWVGYSLLIILDRKLLFCGGFGDLTSGCLNLCSLGFIPTFFTAGILFCFFYGGWPTVSPVFVAR